MTLEDVKDAIEKIKAQEGDSEGQHADEDTLYENLLRAISEANIEPWSDMCREALKTQDMEFARWCA